MTYQEQIKHPKWQKKRLEILERDEFQCRNCQSKTKQLHVHHLGYKKNTLIWDYDNKQLITYCEKCHNNWHTEQFKINLFINKIEYVDMLILFNNFIDNIKGLSYEELQYFVKTLRAFRDFKNVDYEKRTESI